MSALQKTLLDFKAVTDMEAVLVLAVISQYVVIACFIPKLYGFIMSLSSRRAFGQLPIILHDLGEFNKTVASREAEYDTSKDL